MMNRRTISLLTIVGLILTAGTAAAAATSDNSLISTGKKLFEDKTLSASGQVACASCHPGGGHTDNRTYVGLDVVAAGDPNGRSTPTLWGAGTRSVFGWAGTAPSLEANIKGIIVNRMKGAEPSQETLTALAAYVRSLKAPHAAAVRDDGTPAPSAPAAVKRGFELFTGEGECGACHVLPSLDKAETEDVGAGGKFKVPALWSVSKTAPYFHDGRYATLKESVQAMWAAQKKKSGSASTPTDAQLSDLLAYLNAL